MAMKKRCFKMLTVAGAVLMLLPSMGAWAVEKTPGADNVLAELMDDGGNMLLAQNGPPGEGMPGGGGGGPEMGGAPGGPGGGAPGGPGGPGGDGNIGAEAASSEPVVSAAESRLSDFDTIQNRDAVITVYDFGLMDADAGGAFRPDEELTLEELATAVSRATALVTGDAPKDPVADCVKKGLLEKAAGSDKRVTGYEAARVLLAALGVQGLSGGDPAVADAFKAHDLTKGFSGLDLGKAISRDVAAGMIANALALSDGTGLIPTVLHNDPVQIGSGTRTIDNTRIFYLGGSAVQNSGESVLVVRNSRIDGDTSVETAPLSGAPGGLLVGGSIRTTLALGQGQAFYLNSEVNSKDWAALSTDGAVPVTGPGQTELSVYDYGGVARTLEGGYGTYSDLFCNVYLYGTALSSAEIAIISGTYGRVTVGTLADGEADKTLAARLTPADKEAHDDRDAGSVITGGRNAVMIHSVSLPPYWEYEGYSQEEIPLYAAELSFHGSTLGTDLGLDKHLAYPAERQAYIDHHAGSVIAVKSCNTDIDLDGVTFAADPTGSGALIHTLINNDSMFMIKVPDGEVYPGVKVGMSNMRARGDILNEDYQRDMYLTLTDAALSGKIVSGTVGQWNALAREKGFEAYIIDPDGYETVHGVNLTLGAGAVWTVTGESTLTALTLEKGAVISTPGGKTPTMTVDGKKTAIKPGTYAGRIVIQGGGK